MVVHGQPAGVRAELLPCVPEPSVWTVTSGSVGGGSFLNAGVRGLSSARSKELKCEMRASSENVG